MLIYSKTKRTGNHCLFWKICAEDVFLTDLQNYCWSTYCMRIFNKSQNKTIINNAYICGQNEDRVYLFTGLLFNLQQVDLQTLFHLTSLLLSCCLLRTQSGDLQERDRRGARVDVQKMKKRKMTVREVKTEEIKEFDAETVSDPKQTCLSVCTGMAIHCEDCFEF